MSGVLEKFTEFDEYLNSCYSSNTAQAYRSDVLDYCTFLIDYLGDENPEIVEADPDQIFDASVINCVAQWKFKPGTMEGVAVSTLAQTTIKFKLE